MNASDIFHIIFEDNTSVATIESLNKTMHFLRSNNYEIIIVMK
jgi:hypothetical protein